MPGFSKKSPFERLAQLVAITPHEAALALAGINPAFRISEVPKESIAFVDAARKAISRALENHLEVRIATDKAVDANLVFTAAYLFIEDSTPTVIVDRIKEAVDWISRANNWRETLYDLGGLALHDEVATYRKNGRGNHRKEDEQKGTLKMMGVLVKLLADKHPTHKYGTSSKPIISEIYRDVLILTESENISLKGIGKSTFANKASEALQFTLDE